MGLQFEFLAGWWAFCVHCHVLFDAGAITVLAARVATIQPLLSRASLEAVYSTLAAASYGDPVEWMEGQEWSSERFPCPEEPEP